MRLRFLPVAMMAVVLLLTLKIGDVWRDAGDMLGTTAAVGAEHETPAADGAAGGGQDEAAADESERNEIERDARLAAANVIDISPTEIRILENLVKRRAELEMRERDVDLSEKLLAATELRVDEKIGELKKIHATIEGLIDEFDAGEDKKIKSLVKIYESMKPKDAARIFNELDLEVLLDVLRNMREAKAAAIIAKMISGKAKVVTSELAIRRELPDITAGSADTIN